MGANEDALLILPSPSFFSSTRYEGTALMFACHHGDVEAVKLLLQHPDIDVNVDDHRSGEHGW